MSRAPISRELLESTHDFPGPYTLKAIGPHDQAFIDAVALAARAVGASGHDPAVSARASSRGSHLCVTVTVVVERADAVLEMYASVSSVPGLRMML